MASNLHNIILMPILLEEIRLSDLNAKPLLKPTFLHSDLAAWMTSGKVSAIKPLNDEQHTSDCI